MESSRTVKNTGQRFKWATAWGLRIVLAGIFFYAGWGKILDPTLFAIKIRNYDLLPDPWVALVAISLPWLEILCAIGIVTRRWERGALMWVVGMLLVFLFGMISAIVRGLDIDCGCFGDSLDRGSLAMALGMDVLLLAIAVRLWVLASNARLPGKHSNDKP